MSIHDTKSLSKAEVKGGSLVIGSYPHQFESWARTKNGLPFFIRPIKPEDTSMLIRFFRILSAQSIYFRFFSPLRELTPDLLVRFTRIYYNRDIAQIALQKTETDEEILGVARIMGEPDLDEGEFSVIVSDSRQGEGIGAALLESCLGIARSLGYRHVWGMVLPQNRVMLSLGRKLGFQLQRCPDSTNYLLQIDLSKQAEHGC